jgi:hypothetical protein
MDTITPNGTSDKVEYDFVADKYYERHGDTTPETMPNTGNGWQLCPKCGGDGHLMRYNSPPLLSGNAVCDVCDGKKIINVLTGRPPQ